MAKARNTRFLNHHGYGELGLSRYLVLYLSFIGWFALGVYLYWMAFWPSTCTPENLLEIYGCSRRLPESGGWVEAALLTWLWATPILLMLEMSRLLGRNRDA